MARRLVLVIEEFDVPLARIMASSLPLLPPESESQTAQTQAPTLPADAGPAKSNAGGRRGGGGGRGLMVRDSDALLRDAIDKASWNMLLDTIQRKAGVLLLLTTNVARKDLVGRVCNGDESLLRAGRVDLWVDFDDPAGAAADAGPGGAGASSPKQKKKKNGQRRCVR